MGDARPLPVPDGEALGVPSAVTEFPNGDLLVNGVSLLEGRLWSDLPPAELRALAEERVFAAWRYLRRHPEYHEHEMIGLAPQLGIRETRRVVCETMLTEHDLLAGLAAQTHEDLIASCDHAIDHHGNKQVGTREVGRAYGVPFRCLRPRGWANLLIACRAAGFSHLAAASCRPSRTMMALGEAAGVAAAMAAKGGGDLDAVSIRALQRRLRERGALDFDPAPRLATPGEPA